MSDLLDHIESIQANEASIHRLFDGEGTRLRGRSHDDPRYQEQLAEAAALIGDVAAGRRPSHYLTEALTTSDFPSLFGDVLDRALLGAYREYPTSYPSFVRVSTVRDFREVKRFALDGAEGQLEQVKEKAPYPGASVDDTADTYTVSKYGRRLPLTWETMVNDDLDAFRDLPNRLARAARRSEQKFVTTLYVDSSGPHASLYDAGFSNVVTGNPVLSLTALQTAMTVLANQRDTDGEPIYFETVYLVVPPALEVTANNIINAMSIDINEAGGSTNTRLRAENWMRNRVKVIVDPYIPIVASSSNGATSWFLFGNPADGRPALEVGFLRGHQEPALFMKRPDAQRIGGTAGPDGELADFDTDSVQYKVRHVFGGTRLTTTGGAKSTVASEGDGS
jgi:hypothetical protein